MIVIINPFLTFGKSTDRGYFWTIVATPKPIKLKKYLLYDYHPKKRFYKIDLICHALALYSHPFQVNRD